MKTVTQSPTSRVAECAAVFRIAKLNAFARFSNQVGHHVEVVASGKTAGRYVVTPAHGDRVKVRWFPRDSPTVILSRSETPARAAGLILDHQEGLVLSTPERNSSL